MCNLSRILLGLLSVDIILVHVWLTQCGRGRSGMNVRIRTDGTNSRELPRRGVHPRRRDQKSMGSTWGGKYVYC